MDNAWTGHVCTNPIGNHACMALRRISEGRRDDFEQSVAGKAWSELEAHQLPPCADEHGAFMSERAYSRRFNHPYVGFEEAYSGFLSCSFVKIFARRDDPAPFSAQGIVDVCGAHGWGQSLQTTVDHTLMRGLGTA
jgi:hypothetical protein